MPSNPKKKYQIWNIRGLAIKFHTMEFLRTKNSCSSNMPHSALTIVFRVAFCILKAIFLRKNIRAINLVLFGDATLNHSNARYWWRAYTIDQKVSLLKSTLRKRNIIWRQAKTVEWWLVAHVFLSFLVAPKPEIVVARLMSLSTGSCGRRFHPEFASNRLFFNKIVAYQESVFPEYPRVYRARATTNAT